MWFSTSLGRAKEWLYLILKVFSSHNDSVIIKLMPLMLSYGHSCTVNFSHGTWKGILEQLKDRIYNLIFLTMKSGPKLENKMKRNSFPSWCCSRLPQQTVASMHKISILPLPPLTLIVITTTSGSFSTCRQYYFLMSLMWRLLST